jgi:hypothetical protein
LFIDNCLAAAGADLTLKTNPDNVTYIFDNEPRNKEIVKRMYKIIDSNYNIFIWPDDTKCKDIISNNTHNKLSALSKLNTWKKCSI